MAANEIFGVDHDAPTASPKVSEIAFDETLTYVVVNTPAETEGATQGPDPLLGTKLMGRFRLISKLGEGGMGAVYLAEDDRLSRSVAVKVIRDRLWKSIYRDSTATEFESEAKLGASLVHPSIASVYDYGFHDDVPFTVFEFVSGESLTSVIRRLAPMPHAEVADVISKLALALDYAHEKGIVHRDLKPDNVRLDETGRPKILDFGLAKRFLTHADWRFAGTPAYASPEQAREEPSDGRTDQYALALIAFEMLTGQRPFSARTRSEILNAHAEKEVEWPAGFEVSTVAKAAVTQALSKFAHQRYKTCSEFAVQFGCAIETGRAKTVNFELECPVQLASMGFFANHAHVGLIGHEMWICSLDRLYVINAEKLASVSAVVPRLTAPGVLGRPILGTSLEPQFQATMSLSTGGRWWQIWMNTLPNAISTLQFPSKEVAKRWSEKLQPLCIPRTDSNSQKVIAHVERRPPAVVSKHPDANVQIIGPCAASGSSKRAATLKLQLQAAVIDADTVLDFQSEKLVTPDGVQWKVQGIAARSLDGISKDEFSLREYGKRVWRLALVTIGFIAVSLALRWGILDLASHLSRQVLICGLSMRAALILYSLPPMVLAGIVMWKRWPQLLRPLALFVAAWASLSLLVLLGVLLADWNDAPAAEVMHDLFALRRKLRRLDGIVAATGIALAVQLAIALRKADLINGPKAIPSSRISVQVSLWVLGAVYFLLPIVAIGWGLSLTK